MISQWGKCGANFEKEGVRGLGTRGVPVPGRRHGKASGHESPEAAQQPPESIFSAARSGKLAFPDRPHKKYPATCVAGLS